MPSNYYAIKNKIRFYLNDDTTFLGKFIDFFVIALNLFTVCIFVIETYIHHFHVAFFWTIEIVTVSIFIIEYLLRLWTAENKGKYIFSIYSIIDLVAIIPTFMTFIDLRFIRIVRVFRIFRLMRFVDTGAFLTKDAKLHELIMIKIIFTIISIIFVFSSFIYEAERFANPNISSIGDAVYFSIVTLTTVGFGDIVPVTNLGKSMTILMILMCVAIIPWQLGLFIKEITFTHSKKHSIICEHCGLKQHDSDAIHCKYCGSIIYHEINGKNDE